MFKENISDMKHPVFPNQKQKHSLAQEMLFEFSGSPGSKKNSLGSHYEYVLEEFISNARENYCLIECVVQCCLLVEAIIKKYLSDINPALLLDKIDPIDIAILSGKEKKLILKTSKEKDAIFSAKLRQLLERYKLFYP